MTDGAAMALGRTLVKKIDDRVVNRLRLARLVGAVVVIAAGLALARAPLETLVAAIVVLVGGLLLVLRPVLGVYALAIAVPFGSLREWHVAGVSVGLSEVLVLGIGASWSLRWMALGERPRGRAPLVLAVSIYLGTVLASLLSATSLVPAVKELAKWAEFLLIYSFVAYHLDDGQRRYAIAALLLAGTLQGLLGVYQFVFQVGPPGFVLLGRYMRAHGTFLQPNPFGGYLGLLLPMAYGIVLVGWRALCSGSRRRSAAGLAYWACACIASAAMAAALLMSWSRGALAGLVAGALCVALFLRARAWTIAGGGLLVLAVAAPDVMGMLPSSIVERMTDILRYLGRDLTEIEITDENFSVIERLAHWQAAWRMFSSKPWLGVGAGQYAQVYPSVSIPRWGDPLGHAHNWYLNVLAEGGLVGLSGYVVFVSAALVQSFRRARRAAGWQRAIALGAVGMLAHLLAHSLFDNLYVHEMYLIVAMVLGISASVNPDSH